ncbi:MAG: hypothetical protein GY761_03100 [Hyphomicrobiales bacterium]|nr:hypothetical protein [Hyphomicrobiales bacterium]
MPSPAEIFVSQLSRLIGLPDALVVIDICLDEDFAEDRTCEGLPVERKAGNRHLSNILMMMVN